ncbi:hypothetical protein E4U42_003651 [Claviceps africana]|uniref:DUF7357 domain-containing protein n=1 Tax=Claviceps africana TaxID=83212 RepID=A0A8K0J6R1_9HYPO|nr:hypothetical protein E4U42_003651 [Claviceps africana]
MSTQDIRLRLAVRRHGVPEVKLVWPCKRSADVTIAKLLASVNEAVPLESGEWGLEDYAVELVGADGDSYECLHFQLVAQTLKDEDQLIIRSLLTDDVIRRRISGRHQISADGKHLVDGVAFGRPWLRAPRDRPAIELPPRKRARIEGHEMGMAELEPDRLLLLEGPPELRDEENDGDDDGEGDADWKPKQRRNISCDSSEQDENDGSTSDGSDSDGEHLEWSREELDEEIKALRDADSASKDDHSDTHECSVEHLAALRTAYPLLSFATIEKELSTQKQNLRKTYDALQKSTNPSLSFDDMMDRMVMGILDQTESSPVQERPVDILLNRRPPPQRPLIEEVVSDGPAASSSSDATSSDDVSSSESSSEDEGDEDEDDDDDESSFHGDDGSSSGSSSDDGSEGSSDESSSDSSDESVSEPVKDAAKRRIQQDNAPSQGLSRTQKRNARRRKQKAMIRQTTSTPSAGDAELRARKEALLGALQADVGEAGRQESPAHPGAAASTPNGDATVAAATSAQSSAQRRARVDMSAGRRMLFGALGLKNPKSKADEERIKQGLMSGAKPLHNSRIVEVDDDGHGSKQAAPGDDDDPDAWKSRVRYRAVECCHEGMELSEPPFPFVQRWDPQQQYGSMRKRKRKAQELDADDFYEPSRPNGCESTNRDPFKSNMVGKADTDAHVAETTFASNGTNGHAEADEADEAEDLPPVPEDPSRLPALERGAAKQGMVITWKQCTMSKATQWQPVMSSLTGEVLVSDPPECGGIPVRLAFRDREYKEKVYDERTGQRIYDKFETPDFEDEDGGEEDDGLRTVAWEEMTEPRILAATSPWMTKGEAQA